MASQLHGAKMTRYRLLHEGCKISLLSRMDRRTPQKNLEHEAQSNLGCADVELVQESCFQCMHTLYVMTTISWNKQRDTVTDQPS